MDAKPKGAPQNEDMHGLAAFRAAIQRQEGQFMRGATVILNPPKDLKLTDNQRIATALQDRNASGQFVKKE